MSVTASLAKLGSVCWLHQGSETVADAHRAREEPESWRSFHRCLEAPTAGHPGTKSSSQALIYRGLFNYLYYSGGSLLYIV